MSALTQSSHKKSLIAMVMINILFFTNYFLNIAIRSMDENGWAATIPFKLILPALIALIAGILILIANLQNKKGKFSLKDYQWAIMAFLVVILVSTAAFYIEHYIEAFSKLGDSASFKTATDYILDKYKSNGTHNYDPFVGYLGGSYRMEGVIAFATYAMFFVAGSLISVKDHAKFILAGFMIVMGFTVFYGTFEHFGGVSVAVLNANKAAGEAQNDLAYWFYKAFYDTFKAGIRPKVFCGNINFLVTPLVLTMGILSTYLVYTKSNKGLIGGSVFMLFTTFVLVVNNSRSGWIGIFAVWAVIFVFIIRDYVKNKNFKDFIFKGLKLAIPVIMFAGFMCYILFTPVVKNEYTSRIQATIDQATGQEEEQIDVTSSTNNSTMKIDKNYVTWASGRGHSYKWGLEMIKEKPLLGYGADNFRYGFPDEAYNESKAAYGSSKAFDKAHNDYVNMGATIGLLGLFAYLVFLGLVLYNGKNKILEEEKNDSDSFTKKMLFAAVIGYISQAYFNISVLQVAPFFFALMGLLVADYIPHLTEKQKKRLKK